MVATVLTDSAEMYQSRIKELQEENGEYDPVMAAVDYTAHIASIRTDSMKELTYEDRKRIHNLKYYTWVEQQGRTSEELNAQWYDREYWLGYQAQKDEIDKLIKAFNDEVGIA